VQPEERRDEAIIGENEVTFSSRSRRSLAASADCVYETDPAAPEITIHFKPGEVVKLEDEFQKAFKYIHGRLNGVIDVESCPVTHIYQYATPAGVEDVPPALLADATYTIPAEPGSSQMFFRLGSEVAKSPNVIGAKLTICGHEAIEVIDETPFPLALTKYGGNKLYVLHDTVFEGWFKENFAVAG